MKTKILVIGALPPPTGGMETVTEQMANLKLRNYDIKIFNVAKNKIIKSNIIFNTLNFFYRCIKLFFTIILTNPKMIHVHITINKDFLQKSAFIKISKLLNKKVILHIHGGGFKDFYNESSSYKKKNIIKTLNSVNSIITLSDSWQDYFKKLCHNKNIFVLPNAVDLKTISYYSNKNLKNLKNINKSNQSQNNTSFRLLFIGRIEKQKGIYELLKALKEINEEKKHKKNNYNNKIVLDCMGSFTNNENEIRTLVERSGLSDSVNFLGVIQGEERFKYFAQSHAFILPSYWEGLPLSVIEAMAFGLPIISTKVGAIPEIVDNNNGILVRPKDVTELKNAIIKIRDDKKKIPEYKINNIKKIRDKYDISQFKKTLEEIYNSSN